MANDVAKFYFRSFCDSVFGSAFFAASTDYVAGSLLNANDRDKSTCAITSGKNSDTSQADFIIDLGEEKSIDTIALWSNFRTFGILYYHDSAWYLLADHGLGYAPASTSVFNLTELSDPPAYVSWTSAPVTTRYLKISTLATNPANAEKKLYEVIVTAKICELPISSMDTLEQNLIRINAQNLRGGSVQLVFFPQSPKFHAVLNFNSLTDLYADYDELKDYFLLDACCVYLYFTEEIAQIGPAAFYLCNDIAQKTFPLVGENLLGGVNGSIELLEV